MSNKNKTVFVAMSGGVDSSVAAYLLKKQGYTVVGVFMRCFNLDGCQDRDAEDARRVAEHLQIPFYVWDFEEEYKKKVVEYMIDGYRNGITPNPDVMCNKEIKFGLFLERALRMGADYVATGHYVKLVVGSDEVVSRKSKLQTTNYKLLTARDAQKDQSYFLWTLTQKQLARCLFPIGNYLKPDVREIARKAGLPTADKKDSQGICFLGKVSVADFLKQYIPEKRGVVVNVSGEKVGEHRGAAFYTIGQRHIGISAAKSKGSPYRRSLEGRQRVNREDSKPFYVAEKNIKTNTLVVAEGSENKSLYRKEIELADTNFITPQLKHPYKLENVGMFVWARVRYRQPLARAVLLFSYSRELENKKPQRKKNMKNASEMTVKLIFNQSQKFVAPGQSAVFYVRDPSTYLGQNSRKNREFRMLGGGVIG